MYKNLTLKDLGAENCINLLQPIKCNCGCGGYANMVIKDEKDYNIFTVAGSLLAETDCNHAWIFVIESWAVSGAYTTEDENGDKCIQYFTTANPENETPIESFEEGVELVKSIIEDIQPHCVGILHITKDGTFRVVTDEIYDEPKIKKVKVRKVNPYLN